MTSKLLAAATLMLVTTASAWANATDPASGNDSPGSGAMELRLDTSMAPMGEFGVADKPQALALARDGMSDLDQQLDKLVDSIDRQWRDLPQAERLEKQEALAVLKEEKQSLEEHYQALHTANAEQWDAARDRFEQSWAVVTRSWRALQDGVGS